MARAGKAPEDGASCTKSLLLLGSFCWQGSERAQAGGAELCPPRWEMRREHEALPAGNSEPQLQIAPSVLAGVSQAH